MFFIDCCRIFLLVSNIFTRFFEILLEQWLIKKTKSQNSRIFAIIYLTCLLTSKMKNPYFSVSALLPVEKQIYQLFSKQRTEKKGGAYFIIPNIFFNLTICLEVFFPKKLNNFIR